MLTGVVMTTPGKSFHKRRASYSRSVATVEQPATYRLTTVHKHGSDTTKANPYDYKTLMSCADRATGSEATNDLGGNPGLTTPGTRATKA